MTNPVNADTTWGDRIYKLKMKKRLFFLTKTSLNDYILTKYPIKRQITCYCLIVIANNSLFMPFEIYFSVFLLIQ